MNNKEIKSIIEYIENNLNDEININALADRYFISQRQLYRDFYSYTGYSLKEYIRKRRISNACALLKYSDTPLVDVAMANGYETQQSFHKQFKSVINMTPLEYKNSDMYFSFYSFNLYNICVSVKVSDEYIPQNTVYTYYSTQLRGIEDRAVAQTWNSSGRLFGRNGKQKGNLFCYELMTVSDEDNTSGDKKLCAVCTVKYNDADINNGWDYLYNTWLRSSMFESDGSAYYEEYIFNNGKANKLKLYLPIKKRALYQIISLNEQDEMIFLTARKRGYNSEQAAANAVINFVRDNYPYLIDEHTKYYVSCYDDIYECGIQIPSYLHIPLPYDSNIQIITKTGGTYITFQDICSGDMRLYTEKISLFISQNNLYDINQPAFAIYEVTDGNFNVNNIKMTIYKRVKDVKKG